MENKKRIKKIICENNKTIQYLLYFIVDTKQIEILLTDTKVNLEYSAVYARRLINIESEKNRIQSNLAETLNEMYEEYEEKENIFTTLKDSLKDYNVFEIIQENE